jgi:hypothetical protein
MRFSSSPFLIPKTYCGPKFSAISDWNAPIQPPKKPIKLNHTAFNAYPNFKFLGFENTQQLLNTLDTLGDGKTVESFCQLFDSSIETEVELWRMKDPQNPFYFMVLNGVYHIVLNYPLDIAACARLERPLIPKENLSDEEYEKKIRRLLPGVKIDEQLQAARRQPNPVVHKPAETQANQEGRLLRWFGDSRTPSPPTH